MPLSNEYVEILRDAIAAYSFPAAYFDFVLRSAHVLDSMKDVELRIQKQLKSGDPSQVMDGLSNVLYWGWAQKPGLQDFRIRRFRRTVKNAELNQAAIVLRSQSPPSVLAIKQIGLPEFSGLSFVSKIRMFLDPEKSAVLDRQILTMNNHCADTVLGGILIGNETTIRITEKHARVYDAWCEKLLLISQYYPSGKLRVVDIERGFFHLIQTNRAKLAASILRDA